MKKDLEKKYFRNKKVKAFDKKSKYKIEGEEDLKFVGYKKDKILFRGKNGKIVEIGIDEKIEQVLEDGGNIQVPYFSASEVCFSLDTLVPAKMSQDQRNYNQYLKSAILVKYGLTVEQYVADKLHYKNVDDLCYDNYRFDDLGNRRGRFAQEQIDAIATSIWNHEENNVAIIVADQTGVGKGRTAAGLIRYCYFNEITPIFFTEKKHLINDIYRDLFDIGFAVDAIKLERKEDYITKEKGESWTEEEVIEAIQEDLKQSEGSLSLIDFTIEPNDYEATIEMILEADKYEAEEEKFEFLSEQLENLKSQYESALNIEGKLVIEYVKNKNYEKEVEEQEKQGRVLLPPFMPEKFPYITDKNGNILYDKVVGSGSNRRTLASSWRNATLKNEEDVDEQDMYDAWAREPYKCVFLTYDSLGRLEIGGKINRNIVLIKAIADNGGGVILDESHNAAGSSSNAFETISDIVFRSSFSSYISATFAKRGENMPIYSAGTSIKEAGLSKEHLIKAFEKGGDALKEAVASELVANGQLVRREKKIQGKAEYKLTSDYGESYVTEEAYKLNQVAEVWKWIKAANKAANDVMKKYNKGKDKYRNDGRVFQTNKEYVLATNTNSSTWRLFNFFLLGLKIKPTVEEAISRLRNGRKVVIAIANTLESALKTMPKELGKKDVFQLGDEIPNNFELYLQQALDNAVSYKKAILDAVNAEEPNKIPYQKLSLVDDEWSIVKQEVDVTSVIQAYRFAEEEIKKFTARISISPIDEIKKRVSEKGYICDEITGRSLQVTFSNNEEGEVDYTKGKITKKPERDKTETIRLFNQNQIDLLIINQSGSTGVSMHPTISGDVTEVLEEKEEIVVDDDGVEKTVFTGAPTSLEPRNEVKKRCMIITQMELNINTEVQKLGRINRTGQVYTPEFVYITSTIASEKRITSMNQRKLKSLMSNVSANQEQSSDLFSSEDFFSKYGAQALNIAIEQYRTELDNLGIPVPTSYIEGKANETLLGVQEDLLKSITSDVDTGEMKSDKDVMKYTKFLYLIPYDLQNNFYKTFSRTLNDIIDHVKKIGDYEGALAYKDYKAEVVDKVPIYIGNDDSQTSFGGHIILEKAKIQVTERRNTMQSVEDEIQDNVSSFYDRVENSINEIKARLSDDIEGVQAVSGKTREVYHSVEAKLETIKEYRKGKKVAYGQKFYELNENPDEISYSRFVYDFKQYLSAVEMVLHSQLDISTQKLENEKNTRQNEINILQEKIKGSKGLQEYQEKKEQYNQTFVTIKEIEEKQLKAQEELDLELANSLMQEKFAELKKQKELKEFIDSNEEEYEAIIIDNKDDARKLKTLKEAQEKVDREILKNQEEKLKQTEILKDIGELSTFIGSICNYKTQEIKYYEEEEYTKESINIKTQTIGVFSKVNPPTVLGKFTPGKIDIQVMSYRKDWDYNGNLSQIGKYNVPIAYKDKGYEGTFVYELTGERYFEQSKEEGEEGKTVWQSIAGKTELVVEKTGYFLSGTPLRASRISSQNTSFSGNVVKYTDSNEREKLSLEVKQTNTTRKLSDIQKGNVIKDSENNHKFIENEYFQLRRGRVAYALNPSNFETLFKGTLKYQLIKYIFAKTLARVKDNDLRERLIHRRYINGSLRSFDSEFVKYERPQIAVQNHRGEVKFGHHKPVSMFITDIGSMSAICVSFSYEENLWGRYSSYGSSFYFENDTDLDEFAFKNKALDFINKYEEEYLNLDVFRDIYEDGVLVSSAEESPSLWRFLDFISEKAMSENFLSDEYLYNAVDKVAYYGDKETIDIMKYQDKYDAVYPSNDTIATYLGMEKDKKLYPTGNALPLFIEGNDNKNIVKDYVNDAHWYYIMGNARDVRDVIKSTKKEPNDSNSKVTGIPTQACMIFNSLLDFQEGLKKLNEYNIVLECVTSQEVVNSQKDLFVFEKFTSNVVAVDSNSEDETRFLPTEQGSDEVINKMIDELVKII